MHGGLPLGASRLVNGRLPENSAATPTAGC